MDESLEQLTINVRPAGGLCNLGCAYCDSSKARTIAFDEGLFLQRLQALSKSVKSIRLVFHGGEPLLFGEEALLCLIRNSRTVLGSSADIQLQTNGTLLTLQLARELTACQCRLSVSLDPSFGNVRGSNDQRSRIIEVIRSIVGDGIPLGIVSVAHRLNQYGFSSCLRELSSWQIPYWTINRVRAGTESPFFISEGQYIRILSEIMKEWIERRLYVTIKIQPLLDLLSGGQNHSCRFSPIPMKCNFFSVFQGAGFSDGCEHYPIQNDWSSRMERCKKCHAFDFCGGGCPADEVDEEFCNARKHFRSQISAFRSFLNQTS